MEHNTELHQDERPGMPEPLPADAQHHRQDGPNAGRGGDEQDEEVLGEEVVEDELSGTDDELVATDVSEETQGGSI